MSGGSETGDRPPIRVLVVDDEEVARAVVSGMVEGDPTLELVAVAGGVEKAVELAAEHQPDIALLDWVMPGGGGSQAALEMKQVSPQTRIIGLSSMEGPQAQYDMMRSGAIGFLSKGVSREELVRTIHSTMRW